MKPATTARSWPMAPVVVFTIFVAAIGFLVASSLAPRSILEFPPAPIQPRRAPDSLVVDTVTIQAADPATWSYFHIATRTVHRLPAHPWDLAFRRFHVVTSGGAADLGPIPFDSVAHAPTEGYVVTNYARDTTNAALRRWYRYGFLSHLLTPKGHTIALHTIDGRYAKLAFLSYYCAGSMPGCITLRVAYQGNGSRQLSR